jgi:hypothetical protein
VVLLYDLGQAFRRHGHGTGVVQVVIVHVAVVEQARSGTSLGWTSTALSPAAASRWANR